MGLFDCGRCGATFPSEDAFVDHRREVHGIVAKQYPAQPQGSHEKNLNGHLHAGDIRRDPNRGQAAGGNRSVD